MSLPTYKTTYDAVQAMQAAFDAFWQALSVRTVVTYDNVPIDAVGTSLAIVSNDPEVFGEGYLYIQVLHADGQIASLGSQLFRQTGIMSGALFVENSRGRIRTAGKLGDSILKFFQITNIAGIRFTDPRINEVGPDGRWWQVNILSDFQYDIVRS